jgi:hypothetical protein
MVDFTSLLSKKVDDVKPPAALPEGTYDGIISKFEFRESKERKTPMLAVELKFLSAHDDVNAEELAEIENLTAITRTQNFILTDNALFRLADFIKSCGINTVGRSMNETIPELIGQSVLISVSHRLDPQDPTKKYWDIKELTGAHA